MVYMPSMLTSMGDLMVTYESGADVERRMEESDAKNRAMENLHYYGEHEFDKRDSDIE